MDRCIYLNQGHFVALPCLGPLAPRGAIGARHDGLPRQFSPLLPVVCHGLSLSEGFAGPLCDRMLSLQLFFGLPLTFFDCLRPFPVVLLWIGRPILSRAHTISVYAALQLPGDLRTVLYALRWFTHFVTKLNNGFLISGRTFYPQKFITVTMEKCNC